MGRRILNEALRKMVNAERRGKATTNLQPISTTMDLSGGTTTFMIPREDYAGYIKDFEVFDPHRVGKITVQLHGRINDAKALTFRQDLKARYIEEYRIRTLPTQQWGYVVITTPNGVLDHEEAIKQNVGGQFMHDEEAVDAENENARGFLVRREIWSSSQLLFGYMKKSVPS
ncbi:Small ribosomal subunit protein uS8my [Asimina triloba]